MKWYIIMVTIAVKLRGERVWVPMVALVRKQPPYLQVGAVSPIEACRGGMRVFTRCCVLASQRRFTFMFRPPAPPTSRPAAYDVAPLRYVLPRDPSTHGHP